MGARGEVEAVQFVQTQIATFNISYTEKRVPHDKSGNPPSP